MEEMPPGFRFFPTEEELVCFYLHNKIEGTRQDVDRLMNRVIPVLDIYDFNPWDLPQLSGERCQRDPEQWFFFIPRQEREARGGRTNRLTNSGYWKATGSPGYVYSSANHVIGVKKTMVFYEGRAPRGRKTKWKMNEYYKAIERENYNPSTGAIPMLRQEFSLCRVYLKSKCLRAFDRRPSEVVIHEARAQQAHGDEATISHHENHPTVEKTSLPESSSPGDHGDHPSQTGKSNTSWEMNVDNEPLWEWEQLNWI